MKNENPNHYFSQCEIRTMLTNPEKDLYKYLISPNETLCDAKTYFFSIFFTNHQNGLLEQYIFSCWNSVSLQFSEKNSKLH